MYSFCQCVVLRNFTNTHKINGCIYFFFKITEDGSEASLEASLNAQHQNGIHEEDM